MTGKHPLPVGIHTEADALRDDLSQCENLVVRITSSPRPWFPWRSSNNASAGVAKAVTADGLAFLQLLDHVADELERLKQRGMDLRAEQGRFNSILDQLSRRDKAFVARMGTAMAANRSAGARWWWYLDDKVAADRRRYLKRLFVIVVVGAALFVVFYLLYDRFIAPPPHIRQANRGFFQGEQAVIDADPTLAIERFETVVSLDPERAEAHLWLSVLYESIGDVDQATTAFEKALELYGGEYELVLQRAMLYQTLNNIDAAYADAERAIELEPDQPEGHFIQGSVAEQAGDMAQAVASFEKTAELAEAAGKVELQATARIRLAGVLQRLTTGPESSEE
jgi:tetratricopeptide (TPR) repeat protein